MRPFIKGSGENHQDIQNIQMSPIRKRESPGCGAAGRLYAERHGLRERLNPSAVQPALLTQVGEHVQAEV